MNAAKKSKTRTKIGHERRKSNSRYLLFDKRKFIFRFRRACTQDNRNFMHCVGLYLRSKTQFHRVKKKSGTHGRELVDNVFKLARSSEAYALG